MLFCAFLYTQDPLLWKCLVVVSYKLDATMNRNALMDCSMTIVEKIFYSWNEVSNYNL